MEGCDGSDDVCDGSVAAPRSAGSGPGDSASGVGADHVAPASNPPPALQMVKADEVNFEAQQDTGTKLGIRRSKRQLVKVKQNSLQ